MNIDLDLTSAQAKALIREIEEADLHRHSAVDDLIEAISSGLEKAGEKWDCEWCGGKLRSREDFEEMLCPRCREARELMEIADLRAIRREMERESIGRLPYVVGR